MRQLGWDSLDILLVSGDAYVDHPSFGIALLGRWLEAHGFRVGVVPQPRWEDAGKGVEDIGAMGRPRLFAGVSAGAIDSMLAHYTAFRKKRGDDAYTPGGKAGARPNRACIVYTGLLRRAFPGIPVVLGGIEASLRRAVHYDFWTDSLRNPILQDSKADLLVCGMGESGILHIAQKARELLDGGNGGATLQGDAFRKALVVACGKLPGIARMASRAEIEEQTRCGTQSARVLQSNCAPQSVRDPVTVLPSLDEMRETPFLFMQATLAMEKQAHTASGIVAQPCGDRVLIINPPAPPLSQTEMDRLYSLPYSRLPHPSYNGAGAIPAWEMIRTSITTHRGCGGGCSFCSLALHQGRHIASRSRNSVVREAQLIAAGPGGGTGKVPRWAGSISDVGGPSANMWQARCTLPAGKNCARASCMHPEICPFFQVDQRKGVALMREIAALPGVRHVRVASGVRFDLALRDTEALYAYTSEFTGGQLKVAPEHTEDAVLRLMRKPGLAVFERFLEAFRSHCHKSGKELYTVPYLISAFPGCTEEHMRGLARWLRARNWSPRQVQCFIPTPGTVATAMFYSGAGQDGAPLYVARTDRERLRQHHMLLGGEDGARSRNAPRGRGGTPKRRRE